MKNDNHLDVSLARPASLRTIFGAEWQFALVVGLFCFFLASVLMTGWPAGLVPNVKYPYIYAADGLSHSWLAQRAIEGWIFDNPRSGYPFGSNFLDYPGSDSGNLFVLKLLGQLTGSYYGALNLYFLIGFAVIAVTAYAVMRSVGVGRAFSLAGAVLFSFIPFHFQRLGHLFYTWYFVAPLFFYLALKIANTRKASELAIAARRTPRWLVAVGLLALGSFGVYYAMFGLIMLTVVVLSSLLNSNPRSARLAALAACVVVAGVLLNLAPNIVHKYRVGDNPEVAQRSPGEAEIHGFKMVQLLLPRPDHRVEKLGNVSKKYGAIFPMVHENFMSSLGMVGALGFVASLLVVCAAMAGRQVGHHLRLVALITLVLFMFGTIGGFGSLFSMTISSSIRGWNRISIFIAFGGLLTFFILLQAVCSKLLGRKPLAMAGIALVLMAGGLYDQTTPACQGCNLQTRTAFELDRDFVGAIEQSLPPGSAVYQLPYMGFPEVMPQVRLQTYDLAAGFLQSRSLKWSYAGMKGRDGDAFYRALAMEPAEKQLDVARRLAFAGIYIDRRGYEDNGQALIQRFTELLGAPPVLQRADKEVVFFRLGPVSANPDQLVGLTHAELMRRSGFMVDHLGKRYEATLAQGIDFTRADFPLFLANVTGMAGPEPWGRWTDANVARSARIDFAQPLPARFNLLLTARPFGPNADKELVVRIGSKTFLVTLKEGQGDYRLAVDLGNERANRIEFVPAQPVSPLELGWNTDTRKLGVGLIRVAIE